MKKEKRRWVKLRHKIVTFILKPFLSLYTRIAYGFHFKRTKLKKPHLILYNHQSDFDQFMIGISFNKPIYYVASEDLFAIRRVSALIKWLVAPIPFKKSSNDLGAVKTCLRVVKEGGSIAIAPEGNRTYSGKTEYIKPSISKLVKTLGIPVILYNFEGGFGIKPRWSDRRRRGKMRGFIKSILQPSEYKEMDNEALYNLIKSELFVDDNQIKNKSFKSKYIAEYLERVIYLCPNCGVSHFQSKGNVLSCLQCDFRASYKPDLTFSEGSPYKNVNEWYEAQKQHAISFDFSRSQVITTDEVSLYKFIPNQKKDLLGETTISLTNESIRLFDKSQGKYLNCHFSAIKGLTCIGRNRLNLYINDSTFQIKGTVSFNPVKYVLMYYSYYNHHNKSIEGEENDNNQFLGL